MKRSLVALAATLSLIACEPDVKPPPVPPPVITWIHKALFWHAVVSPGPNKPPETHSCAIIVEPADQTLHAPYSTVDPVWNANGWAFWSACVIASRDIGYAIPAVKITQDPNNPGQTPNMFFTLDTAPVFGRGSGHYNDFNAANIAVWRKGYVEAAG
jgi:hypothetical protein